MYLKHSRKVCYMNHRNFLDPNHKWRSDKRRFNGDVETGKCPQMLSGREVEVLLDGYVNTFGKGKKRKDVEELIEKHRALLEINAKFNRFKREKTHTDELCASPTKQMQPHVIVRPRSSLFKTKDKNAEKRKYVTLKNINDEKKRMMSSRKKLQFGNTIASPTKEGITLVAATEEEETDDSGKRVGLAEYLQKFQVAGGGKEV
ncbi:hypothetical protein POM88_016513 [Heracleum sosnowskyi]|uniref:Uncharacterized protein n=1 Tax=Heracleum sosnowskyi TaxID=360622 RepID=A0AAD8MT15_9APIA|nr:hypothetical protein POM88_016513 [Heracleum sosnowskyi]